MIACYLGMLKSTVRFVKTELTHQLQLKVILEKSRNLEAKCFCLSEGDIFICPYVRVCVI